MPICIECRYPVPQLSYTSTSSKPAATGASDNVTTASGLVTPGQAAAAGAFSTPSLQQGHQHRQSSGQPASHQRQSQSHNGHQPQNSRSKGGGESARRPNAAADVRLTQCPRCKRFADKYVEHDFVVLFIDLVLVKPQVYRHLLFNRLGHDGDSFDPAIIRLGTLLLLFDVYLTWSSIEALPPELTNASPIPRLPILVQYGFYLILCTAATLAQHLTIRILARFSQRSTVPFPTAHRGTPRPPSGAATPASALDMTSSTTFQAGPPNFQSPPVAHSSLTPSMSSSSISLANQGNYPSSVLHRHNPSVPMSAQPPRPPGPNAVSTALFVSSCMQLFPILMVVWIYDDKDGQLARGVSWAVGAQNVEALRILLGGAYLTAGGMVAAGATARWLTKRVVLGLVALGNSA